MNSIFRKVDTTLTSVGQQYLYRKMRLLEVPNGALEDDYRSAELLRENSQTREELQLCLKTVTAGDASTVTRMLFGDFPTIELPKLALILWSVFSIAAIAYGISAGGVFVLLIPPLLIINFALSRYFEKETDNATDVLFYLYKVICISESIMRLKCCRRCRPAKNWKNTENPYAKSRKY